jgi:phosphorylase kinase alpha/beta subunit
MLQFKPGKQERKSLTQIEETLAQAGTLEIRPNAMGVYPASSSQGKEAASGYQNAWLRDTAFVAYSRWVTGQVEEALKALEGLATFLHTQADKMEAILKKPSLKLDVQKRPHIRFNGANLQPLDVLWGHAQNDALGLTLWVRLQLAIEDQFPLSDDEARIYGLLVRYFHAIEYWLDEDSGAWEEILKRNSSSIGIVVAALIAFREYRHRENPRYWKQIADKKLSDWIQAGELTLAAQLPFEAPPVRTVDAATLFLIYPVETVTDPWMEHLIVSLVQARLQGAQGIRRYLGDSYYCQDYDRWFPPEKRSSDFSVRIDTRDQFLTPGLEAQWCLFDPLLSVIYARRYRESGRAEDRTRQVEHFNRALAQLTPQYECPELYFHRAGAWAPNAHTPLLWTQANLALALHHLKDGIIK